MALFFPKEYNATPYWALYGRLTPVNRLMIQRKGVVGVHFDPYIRYAVVGDVEAMLPEIDEAFVEAAVSYN